MMGDTMRGTWQDVARMLDVCARRLLANIDNRDVDPTIACKFSSLMFEIENRFSPATDAFNRLRKPDGTPIDISKDAYAIFVGDLRNTIGTMDEWGLYGPVIPQKGIVKYINSLEN